MISINEALAAYMCGGDLQAVRPRILEAAALARQIPDTSLQEENPPAIIKTAAMAAAADVLGCKEGHALRQEALAIARANEETRAKEAWILHDEARCLVRSGRLAEAIPLLRRSVELHTAAQGPRFASTAGARATLAYVLAQTGEPEQAIQEARAAVTNLDRSIPRQSLSARQTAAGALIAAGDFNDAVPLARELLAEPAGALTGQMCLFVAYAEDRQCAAAQPYRAAAEKAVATVPAGFPMRTRIENALHRCP